MDDQEKQYIDALRSVSNPKAGSFYKHAAIKMQFRDIWCLIDLGYTVGDSGRLHMVVTDLDTCEVILKTSPPNNYHALSVLVETRLVNHVVESVVKS